MRKKIGIEKGGIGMKGICKLKVSEKHVGEQINQVKRKKLKKKDEEKNERVKEIERKV